MLLICYCWCCSKCHADGSASSRYSASKIGFDIFDDGDPVAPSIVPSVKRLSRISDTVLKFLEHFKNPDSVNMPLPLPDPMSMPNRTYQIMTASVTTTNVKAYGVSRMRINNFILDVVDMKMNFGVRLSKLHVIGNYSTWFMTLYSGGFNVTIGDSFLDCVAKLEVTRSGELEAADIKMEMSKHSEIVLDFQNAGMLTTLAKNLGQLIFDSFKPYMFKLINNNVRGTINEYLKNLKMTFPNSIPPIDLAIAEMRKIIRKAGYDPYAIVDYQYATSVYSLDVTRINVVGMSSFYRLGNITIIMDNNTIHTAVNIGTELLEGNFDWEAGVAGIFTKAGTASFTIDYIHVQTKLDQPLNVNKRPKLVELKVKVGNIQLRLDGAGTVDYLMESLTNVLPNIVRYQIVQATEVPIRRKVQEYIERVNVEQVIIQVLPLLDQHLSGNASNVVQDKFLEEGLVIGVNELDKNIEL